MTDLLFSLLGGVALISVAFLLLRRFTRLGSKTVGLVMLLLVIGVYVPLSIWEWPGADVFAIHIAIYLVVVYVLAIISTSRASRLEGKSGLHWGPVLIILFFMVVIGVDSVFIMLAQKGVDIGVTRWLLPEPGSGGNISSFFPGTVSRDFYQKEEDYNAYLARMQAQQERGWDVKLGWATDPRAGEALVFKVRIRDRHGQAISGARVRGRFMRPGDVRRDQNFSLTEARPGLYQAEVRLPEPGRWTVALDIHRDDIVHELSAVTSVAEAGH
ncbi:MAG: FixH family protein [Proteobacteria bacterium]|jgi:nitrogen fixation protein FixH|nr:FixH family protein [Pseudomonadota bacterium]MCG6935266.1 FixH family protein [Pseudomonadota bacterium]